MKKKTKIAITGAVLGMLAVAAVIINKRFEIQKKDDTITIIGGADGPTSIFLAGKLSGNKEQDSDEMQVSEEKENAQELVENPMEEAMSDNNEHTNETSAQMNVAEHETEAFYISEIPDDIFANMQGKSYKADCTVAREELRYVHILHTGFDGETKEGELVVNKAIAEDVLDIFKELYEAQYPIEKVCLVDEYDADDESSMSDNNSSAFNFRFISHTTKVSNHGLGMAIDINPLYNPYVKTVNGTLSIEPANAESYVDRNGDNPYKIDHDDLCYQLFTEHGFTWGGDWNHSKDYQHFEKTE